MQKFIFNLVTLLACLPVTSPAQTSTEALQHLLDELTGSGVPGITMSINYADTNLWLGASGYANLQSRTRMNPNNITRMGSTVKTITATTILLLQEEGKLQLDDKITSYLSKDQLKGIRNAELATIRQLLNHSSGIFNYIQDSHFQAASLNNLTKEWHAEDLLKYARNKQPYFKLGADVRYSNTNYILLGWIIEKVCGKPFWSVFQEKIFTPLDFTQTRFAATDKVPAGIVHGYIDLYSNLNVIDATNYSGWDYFTADGGLISNVAELNLFLTSLCTGKIISEASFQEMVNGIPAKAIDPPFFPIEYGLGIFKMDTPWGEAWFHSGDAIGYYACMVYFPKSRTTIVWSANGNYGKIDPFISSKEAMEKIFTTIFGKVVASNATCFAIPLLP
ncbi:serine hydrolase domain-containing protein [Flavihumibacter profundi]|jgi:D-alanyl-D-alanine carboxypeptidase|uniref:serine hydrolase domain-containing protein n=1 Tax=Flavihumibacter profundi TaxID=2716883 RepID=UPI001CC824C9|nr:serine hydrolase domain-containing protein [Flavihumibacter profundi]MBZ5859582.1 beta-lactamase family protein [Flavihumibacter profundi]